jgi:hypothetical protein
MNSFTWSGWVWGAICDGVLWAAAGAANTARSRDMRERFIVKSPKVYTVFTDLPFQSYR